MVLEVDLPPIATEDELARVEELRAAALSLLGWSTPEPSVKKLFYRESLLRFLRARSKVKKSAEMLVASVKWHQSYDLDASLKRIASDTSPEMQALRKMWPCGVHGTDKRGAPVYYGRYGHCDLAAMANLVGHERFLAHALGDQRAIESQLDAASQAGGRHLVTVVCVADLDGLQWTRAARAIPTFKRLTKVLDDNFPERLHVAFVANAPRIFSMLWRMVSPFLADDTKRKVKICGKGSDHLAELSKLVDLAQIPDFLGGGSKCAIPSGIESVDIVISGGLPVVPEETPRQLEAVAVS